MNAERPNTGVDDSFLQSKIILCCGEDVHQLLEAMGRVTGERFTKSFEYRCYRFWKYSDFTLIWSGIGSGCLEPLLYEILKPGKIRKLILIGTAGMIKRGRVTLGKVYFINRAFLGATAIGLPLDKELEPRTETLLEGSTYIDHASIISTDYYYGFSDKAAADRLRERDTRLDQAVKTLWNKSAMVDMETGQFYYFCRTLGDKGLQFLAIKGPSNEILGEHISAPIVLENALQTALTVLQIPKLPVLHDEEPHEDKEKLMEEAKLYWTVQIAVGAALGYIGGKLDFGSISQIDTAVINTESAGKYATNLVLCVPSLLLILIGSIYNLVGNYYTWLAAGTTFRAKQENFVTPTFAWAYFIIAGLIGIIAALSLRILLFQGWPSFTIFAGFPLFALINAIICRGVWMSLCRNAPFQYEQYSKRLSILYHWITLLVCIVIVLIIAIVAISR